MKMQKVEIEIPEYDIWEFNGFRPLVDNDIDCEFTAILVSDANGWLHLKKIDKKYTGHHKFVYKKKPPRKIIYEEVREDYLKRGDLYLDDNGDVNEWVYWGNVFSMVRGHEASRREKQMFE